MRPTRVREDVYGQAVGRQLSDPPAQLQLRCRRFVGSCYSSHWVTPVEALAMWLQGARDVTVVKVTPIANAAGFVTEIVVLYRELVEP